MSDHNRLHQLLIAKSKGEVIVEKKRRGQVEENKKIDFGLDRYQ